MINICRINDKIVQILSNSTQKAVGYGLTTVSIRSPFLLANLSQGYKTSNFFTWLQSKTKKVQC